MPSDRKASRAAKPTKSSKSTRPAPGLPGELHAALAAIGGPLDLAGKARAALEQQIVTLELAPGSVWTEAEISQRLGIGRTPVREALQRLEGDYLVEIVPRLGVRITAIDVKGKQGTADNRFTLSSAILQCSTYKATLVFEVAWACNAKDESYIELLGDKGGVKVGMGDTTILTEVDKRIADVHLTYVQERDRFAAELEKFVAAVQGKGAVAATARPHP